MLIIIIIIIIIIVQTVEQVQELRTAIKLKPLQGAMLNMALTEPERFAREYPKTKAFIEERQSSIALVVNIESQVSFIIIIIIIIMFGFKIIFQT